MKRIWIRVTEELDIKLREKAARRNVPAPDFMRHCIESGLAKIELSEMIGQLSDQLKEQAESHSDPVRLQIDDQIAHSIFFHQKSFKRACRRPAIRSPATC